MEPKNNKIKRVKNGEQHVKDLFTRFDPILHLEERDLSTSISKSSLQRDAKKYKKLALTRSPKRNPNFYRFPEFLPVTKRVNDFTTQDVSQLFLKNLTPK